MSYSSSPSFLALPAEVRLAIYEHLMKCTGVITIWKDYDIAKEVDKTTISLLHVNRSIRQEVQETFYTRQTFQFRSFAAIDNFLLKIGKHHASLIKSIEIGAWMTREREVGRKRNRFQRGMVNVLQWLAGVERLRILDASNGFREPSNQMYVPGHNTVAMLRASPRLARGKIYIVGLRELHFVPPGTARPVDTSGWYIVEEVQVPSALQGSSRLSRSHFGPSSPSDMDISVANSPMDTSSSSGSSMNISPSPTPSP